MIVMLLLKSKLHGLDGTDHSPIPAGPAVLELDSMSLSPTKPGDFDAWAPLLHLLKEEAWFFAGLRRGSFPVPLRREEFWLGDKVLFYEHSTKPSVFNPSYIPLLLSPLFRGIWSLFFLSLSGVLFYSKNQPPSEPLLKKAFPVPWCCKSASYHWSSSFQCLLLLLPLCPVCWCLK